VRAARNVGTAPASLSNMLSCPDVLVLGAGGVLGEAWMMGVLAGIEDASGFDLRECEHFVGTSAGSIVAAHLVAGSSPRRPSTTGPAIELATTQPASGIAAAAVDAARRAGAWALAAGAPAAGAALELAGPGAALVRAAILRRLPNSHGTLESLRHSVERSGARFDGRLRVVAVDRRSGRRVVFGRPGSPQATVGQAIEASCTVPWLFEPVEIGGREYVDGGVWSPTNLDAAPAGRDTHVVCLTPTAGLGAPGSGLVGAARTLARSAASVEALVLRRRGAVVQIVEPDPDAAAAMGGDLMARAPRADVLAAGYAQGRRFGAIGR
jgi:NTE family protein